MNAKILKPTLILSLSASLIACGTNIDAKQIGNTEICIPNQFMLNLGSGSQTLSGTDTAPDIYEAISIDADIIQQAIPEYQSQFGSGSSIRYAPLHVTITQQRPITKDTPAPSQNDYFFSKPNPQLVGYQTDPNDYWEAYEIQPDQSREHWGFCSHYLFSTDNYIRCKRSLPIDSLVFQYSISRSNIDLYPDIDTYLKQKVTEEWRCDQ